MVDKNTNDKDIDIEETSKNNETITKDTME